MAIKIRMMIICDQPGGEGAEVYSVKIVDCKGRALLTAQGRSNNNSSSGSGGDIASGAGALLNQMSEWVAELPQHCRASADD